MGVVRLKLISVCLLLLASPVTYAVDATGFARTAGCSIVDGEHLQLEKFRGEKLPSPIILRIPQPPAWPTLLDFGWFDVSAENCDPHDRCQFVTHSKIRVLHVSNSWFIPFRGRIVNGISGEFHVEFPDGRRMEGTFKAKVRESHSKGTCE